MMQTLAAKNAKGRQDFLMYHLALLAALAALAAESAPFFAHALEQYFTRSQSRSHFFRQVKSRLQTGQVLVGRFC